MKKVVHKNQIIITALAVMIVVAGYLNFTGQEITTSSLSGNSTGKESASATGQTAEPQSETQNDISAEDSADSSLNVTDSGEVVASQENPGEAVMVSNTISSDYFSSAKLSREQTRAKNKETLMEIVNNEALNSADKKAAVQEVAQITDDAQKESDAEMLLEAKGFSEAMVSINDGKADVVVNAEKLTSKEMAQIVDIVKRKTGISAGKIVITPVSVKK